jgi:hypothetical protein
MSSRKGVLWTCHSLSQRVPAMLVPLAAYGGNNMEKKPAQVAGKGGHFALP